MRRSIWPYAFAVLAVVVILLTGRALAQQKELPVETRNFMQAKLQHSQKILEGLALENYDTIIKHGQI